MTSSPDQPHQVQIQHVREKALGKTCQSCSLQLTEEGLDTFSSMDIQPLEPKT